MNCPRCERPTHEPEQRFCNGCGLALGEHDSDETTGSLPAIGQAESFHDATGDDQTVSNETGDNKSSRADDPTVRVISTTTQAHTPDFDAERSSASTTMPSTPLAPSITSIATTPIATTPPLPPTPTTTTTVMTNTTVLAAAPARPAVIIGGGFRFRPITVVGAAMALLTLVSMFATVIQIDSSRVIDASEEPPLGFRVGQWQFDDLGSNLPIAGLLAACCMMAGAVASGFRWRWGAGLAGGAGLAWAGLVAVVLGLAQIPLDAAHTFAARPAENPFTLQLTRDLGYWLLLATAAAGIALFFISLNDSFQDRRRDLNPWIAAVGALSVVVTVLGALLPVNGAVLSDNWYVIDAAGEAPSILLVGRLVALLFLLVTGVFGFLLVRRFGLGLVLGGSLPLIWLGASVIMGWGTNPIGPAWRNQGATEMELHGVTIVGVAALVSMQILAWVAAYNQSIRESVR